MSTDWVEITAPTVDDAIDELLDVLDLDEEDAEIEVVQQPRSGASGRPARVRGRPRADLDGAGPATAPLVDAVDDEDDDEALDEERVDAAQAFCDGLLESFELQGRAEVWIDDEGTLRVEFKGRDLAVLIGRRGKTLQALAEVVRTAVQRRTNGRTRLFVDVEGYRAKRRQALHDYAVRIARRVSESGVEVAMEPMMAGDRKVIHDAANSVSGAGTFSEGEEPRRYVVIVPEPAR